MSIIGSLVGGILGSNASSQAAGVESQAAQQAQQLELQNQQQAQNYQNQNLGLTTSAEQPYQQLGGTAANALQGYIQNGFTAPTLAQAQQTPGYQFALQQGTQAIDANAAATGNLMSGTTGTALQKYGQGLAQNAYQQTYQNALNAYQTNVGAAQGAANTGLSSTGQLASANQAAAQNMSNLALTGGAQQAGQINNAAAATASGYLGSANALSNMAGGLASGAGGLLNASPLGNYMSGNLTSALGI
jgi:hypothetical protein